MGDSEEMFIQDGVLVKSTSKLFSKRFQSYMGQVGTLYIICYANKKHCVEWKPNEVTIESEDQEQEWAVVSTKKRSRTYSESQPPPDDASVATASTNITATSAINSGNPQTMTSKLRALKICFDEIGSFKASQRNKQFSLFDGYGELVVAFSFMSGDCMGLNCCLKGLMLVRPSKRDKQLSIVIREDVDSVELQHLNKSFAALDIGLDSATLWGTVRHFQERPLEAAAETFAKITDYVYRSDTTDHELLNRSVSEYENIYVQGDYALIAKVPELPERKEYPRGQPVTTENWNNFLNRDGKIEDIDELKRLIFRGGVSPDIRSIVWKYLLGYYPWNSTSAERSTLADNKKKAYVAMKTQWKLMTAIQEENFSDYRERKSLIEKDVNRTDRTLEFYAGDNNPNLEQLYDILMTYVMYNFDLGYVQGMSDLLSPLFFMIQNEVDSFWCFTGFINKIITNFDVDQAGIKEQLLNLHTLLGFVQPELVNYLDKHDSGNMFFCFRWLLVWFKRELTYDQAMRFWEVLWTGLPCDNFHLLVCVAILESEKNTLIGNQYGFTEILKHINDLNGKLDMEVMVSQAEAIFYQIKEADHLTDDIRIILGLPIVVNPPKVERESSQSPPSAATTTSSSATYENIFETLQHINT